MDLHLLHVLQSMAEIEKDPHFKSKRYIVVEKGCENQRKTATPDYAVEETMTSNAVSEIQHPNKIQRPNKIRYPDEIDSSTSGTTSEALLSKRMNEVSVTPNTDAVIAEHPKGVYDVNSPAETVILKHPDNVIVVASLTGKAPPPAEGEIRVHTISAAVELAAQRCEREGYKGCSIIIHEGIYINPVGPVSLFPRHSFGPVSRILRQSQGGTVFGVYFLEKDFSLEMIGVNNVRIVNLCDGIQVFRLSLTMKNVSIFDRRICSELDAAIYVLDGGKLSMVDVRINASKVTGIYLLQASRASLFNCTLTQCAMALSVALNCDARLYRCRISDMSYPTTINLDSNFTAVDCIFLNSKTILINGGKSVIHRCVLRGLWVGGNMKPTTAQFVGRVAVGIAEGAHVTLTESKITNFYTSLEASQSNTQVIIQSCKILDCRFGILAGSNASAKVSDCILGTEVTTYLEWNFSGVVEFSRNTTVDQPVIFLDSKTKMPKNDFKNPRLVPMEARVPQTSSKDQSKQTKEATRQMAESNAALYAGRPPPLDSVYDPMRLTGCKKCRGCGALEDQFGLLTNSPNLGAKFKYCSRCQKVCYCSRKCQDADWKDHKDKCKA